MLHRLKLSEYITTEHIIFKDSASSREELIKDLLGTLCANNNQVCQHKELLHKKILEREELRSTAMGREVAIPHGRSTEIDDIFIAFARLKNELIWDKNDGVPVKYVFLVIGPAKEKAHEYLQLLAQISKLLSRQNTRENLEKAITIEDVVHIVNGLKDRVNHMPFPPE